MKRTKQEDQKTKNQGRKEKKKKTISHESVSQTDGLQNEEAKPAAPIAEQFLHLNEPQNCLKYENPALHQQSFQRVVVVVPHDQIHEMRKTFVDDDLCCARLCWGFVKSFDS